MGLSVFLFILLLINQTSSIISGQETTEPPNISLLGGGPVIGILAQGADFPDYQLTSYNYIAASYVKWIEQSGGRVVPVDYEMPFDALYDLLLELNGFLLPGGDADIFQTQNGQEIPTLYQNTSDFIIKTGISFNENGTYWPIWGTCLGFESLFISLADQNTSVIWCGFEGVNQTAPIFFKEEPRKTRILSEVPSDILSFVSIENALTFSHHCGVNVSSVQENSLLSNEIRIVATSLDLNGLEFVAVFEHTRYPFYGVQFHPEKSQFEWLAKQIIAHDVRSSWFSSYLAYFFNQEARKNSVTFKNAFKLQRSLILNYLPVRAYSNFDLVYIFGKNRTK